MVRYYFPASLHSTSKIPCGKALHSERGAPSAVERDVDDHYGLHSCPRTLFLHLWVYKAKAWWKWQQTYPFRFFRSNGSLTALHANASAIGGALASVSHDAVMTPLDVVKQRMQLGLYSSPMTALRSIIRYEGFRALYSSYFTTILMNVPNAAVLVVTNDWMKSILNPSGKQVGALRSLKRRTSVPFW